MAYKSKAAGKETEPFFDILNAKRFQRKFISSHNSIRII